MEDIIKNDISRVRIDGRQLTCGKCQKIIEGEYAIKKRVRGADKRWKREYLCEGCYE